MARPQRASLQPLGGRHGRRPARDLGQSEPNRIVLTTTDSNSSWNRQLLGLTTNLHRKSWLARRRLRGDLDRSWHVCKRQAALN